MVQLGRIHGRQLEARQVRPQHVGPKEWFGFNRHDSPATKASSLTSFRGIRQVATGGANTARNYSCLIPADVAKNRI
jgi:hypothetical protein